MTESEKKIAGPAVHYSLGTGVGGLYGAVAEIAPEVVLTSLKRINKDYPEMTSKYGFKCSYYPTFNFSEGRKRKGWVSQGYYGLDQGPIVMMIENYRSGLIWRLMRRCPYIASGLRRAGFQADGWGSTPTVREGSLRLR